MSTLRLAFQVCGILTGLVGLGVAWTLPQLTVWQRWLFALCASGWVIKSLWVLTHTCI